ncbi:mechanosensitive ion channel family protein [Pedobacter deserti]|uniref:mechanosensitive ion channel family protein n=1 Tax=Pedobacter deserti TaxID=2817382 RepID=UPI002109790D|nr:mechanosensitive ion channel family protein [Pedobacter sp. SYSU D00382]
MPLSFKPLFIVLTCLIATLSTPAAAQLLPETPVENNEAAAPEIPEDSLGRGTPRGMVSGFLKAMSDQNYMRASQYLQLTRRQQREAERERIVLAFQRLLDQGGNIMPSSWISNKVSGRLDDDLAAGTDLVGTITVEGEVINLIAASTEKAGQPTLWQFSSETVNEIAAIKTNEALLVNKALPAPLKERLLAGVPIGHWLAMLLLALLSYGIAWCITFILRFLILKIWNRKRYEHICDIISVVDVPFRLYLAVAFFVAISQQVGISIIVRQKFSGVTLIVGIIAIMIFLSRLTDFIGEFSKNRMSKRGRVSALSVILFLRRTIKVAIIIIGIIAVLSALGVDVTTGLAALGIGGIALALGAQKTVENFVGSVTLIADQPIRVGDFVTVGATSGTVESIGMRSTKLRTGERSVVTIPNGEFSSTRIDNFAHRDRFLFNPVLRLRYETTPDQIRYLLVELRAILYSHPMVNPDPARIRFAGFGESSLNLEVWSYIDAPDFDIFLEVKEDLLLRFMDKIKESGTGLAFPSQTVYVAQDAGISEEQTKLAAEKVGDWITRNEMQLPKFDQQKIDSLKNTIPYPPEGSVLSQKKP